MARSTRSTFEGIVTERTLYHGGGPFVESMIFFYETAGSIKVGPAKGRACESLGYFGFGTGSDLKPGTKPDKTMVN